MPRTKAPPPAVYQLKITLKGARPPIWRRVLVPSNLLLSQLHTVVQRAMGWYGGHLHEFTVGRESYGVPDPDYRDDVLSERRVRLDQLVPREKGKLRYLYDFGDSWDHEILVEKILTPDPSVRYPVCIAGKRECPPEDVGGVWGYADFLEAIADPNHPEHGNLLEWVGGEFDPEAFDLEAVNRQLAALR